jgi:hypothetical protein
MEQGNGVGFQNGDVSERVAVRGWPGEMDVDLFEEFLEFRYVGDIGGSLDITVGRNLGRWSMVEYRDCGVRGFGARGDR